MNYLITGATGFIGQHLVERLLRREKTVVHALVRPASVYKIAELRNKLGVSEKQLVALPGSLDQPLLGLDSKQRKALRGKVDHFFHLAAIYDLTMDAASQEKANVEGTRNALALAEDLKAGCFHYTSTIGVAGLYPGTFREDMLDEADTFPNPYLQTKHDAEVLVRDECRVPLRVYRPSMVVGDSQSGEIDKADGPYYLFPLIQWLKRFVGRGTTLPGITTEGVMNIVPVDFVADAMDHIAHKPGLDGGVFFLTDSRHYTVGELLDVFSRAAGGPGFKPVMNLSSVLRSSPVQALLEQSPARQMLSQAMAPLGMPIELLDVMDFPTRFDNSQARAALADSGIAPPELKSYAANLWRYWQANLAPPQPAANLPIPKLPSLWPHVRRARDSLVWGARYRLSHRKALRRRVEGRVVVITGASSGIGAGIAQRLARVGATVVVTARSIEKLQDLVEDIRADGGSAWAYRCDIADPDSVDRFCKQVLNDHGQVDILINNAGRSIRRSIKRSFDRFHDYERTMQLNYFGAIRMAMNLLPQMRERGRGHVVNVSTVGVQNAPPRFSAYLGSKFALEGWSMAAATEFAHENIRFSLVNYPLVRTPMIAPTRIYRYFPALSPEKAVDWLEEVLVKQPKRKTTAFGLFSLLMYFGLPNTAELIVNTGYQMVPETFGKSGKKSDAQSSEPALPDNVKPMRKKG
jgi:NAD(P)-dependent dehydrogenase (short-subunit alcohol dehydrogenase family)